MKNNQQFDKAFERVLLWALILFSYAAFGQDTLYNKQGEPAYIKYVATVPIPPAPLISVDNVDSKFVYGGTWTHNGVTNAAGFYPAPPNSTIAYTQTAGHTISLTFTGTAIEVYCEKKAGHGSAAFQIDNQTPETIALGSGTGGSSMVFSRTFSEGTHTFKLTVVGGGYVVFDYVKINGTAVTPIPPTTGAIFLTPGISMKSVVEVATTGTKFQLGNGTYPENIVNVPVGVSILPPTSGTAYISFTGSHPQPMADNREVAVFQLKSSSRVNGNQTISGLTILGKFAATGGIIVDNRDNVTISNVKVQDCNFSGVWLKNTTGSLLSDSEITNSSWASSGWVSGEVNIFNVNKVEIHHNKISNNHVGASGLSDKGYGIKSLWNDATHNIKIYSNIIDLPAVSLWNNGQAPNISIEFNQCTPDGIEIYDNDLKNVISLAFHRNTKSGRVWIHDNRMEKMVSSTCAIELICSNVTIERNKIGGAAMFTANFGANGKWVDQIINNNDFISNGINPSWGGTFLIGDNGANMTITNNRITKGNYPLIKHKGSLANSTIVESGNIIR